MIYVDMYIYIYIFNYIYLCDIHVEYFKPYIYIFMRNKHFIVLD